MTWEVLPPEERVILYSLKSMFEDFLKDELENFNEVSTMTIEDRLKTAFLAGAAAGAKLTCEPI